MGNIVVHNEAARWDSFYNLVAASNEPWRDEVLRIIEMPASVDETKRDHREMRLRRLHGGKVWPILDEYYLTPLRSGGCAVISLQSNWRGRRDTIVIRDTVVVMMPFDGHHAKPKAESESKKQRHALRDSLLQYPAWAVKTNLLLWGVVAPNVQVEIPLGRSNRWSLEAEYFVPWFIWANNFHPFPNDNLKYSIGYHAYATIPDATSRAVILLQVLIMQELVDNIDTPDSSPTYSSNVSNFINS